MAKIRTREAIQRYGSDCEIFTGGDMAVHRTIASKTTVTPNQVKLHDVTGACGATNRLVGSQSWRAPLRSIVSGMLCQNGCWS
jgi:hypothetical protein